MVECNHIAGWDGSGHTIDTNINMADNGLDNCGSIALKGGAGVTVGQSGAAPLLTFNDFTPLLTLTGSGFHVMDGDIKTYGSGDGNPCTTMSHDGTDGAITTGKGDLVLNVWGDIDANTNAIKGCGNITMNGASTVDGVDVSAIKLNDMPAAASGNIDCNGQAITNVGNVDGVDVSAISLSNQPAAASGNIDANSNTIENVADIDMDDGATIGQAGGPLITFDGTGSELELTSDGDVKISPTGDIDVDSNTIENVYRIAMSSAPDEDRIAIQGTLGNSNMYGFGIEASTLYAKANGKYRWYISRNADSGSNMTMELEPNWLFVRTKMIANEECEIRGDLNHDGSNVGFYGETPVAQAPYVTISATPTQAEVEAIRDVLVDVGLMAGP